MAENVDINVRSIYVEFVLENLLTMAKFQVLPRQAGKIFLEIII